MKNELITVETLPVIKYHLEQLSKEIKEKVDNATNLVVNDETVKEVKQVRANLNKEFNELEIQRKAVKQAIMSKYDEFEEIYKDNVSNLYKDADIKLKEKIDSVENTLKQEKQEELELFAKQHIEFNNLENIISFKDIPLNITLSASMKSLKDQIVEFVNKIANDMELMKLEEHYEEILWQYMNNGFDYTKAKLNVIERYKQIEKFREQQKEIQLQIDEDAKIVEKVDEIVAPKEVIEDDEIIKVSFTIETTKSNVVELKNWLKERNISYD